MHLVMSRSWITTLSLLLISQLASANVLLIRKDTFLSVDYGQANFTPVVESSGECGLLYAAEPLVAQKAGYKAAIVNINGNDKLLLPKNSWGKVRYAGQNEAGLWLIPGLGTTSSCFIIAITFISLQIFAGFGIRRQRVLSFAHGVREFSRMPKNWIQGIPIEVFEGFHKVGSTSITCIICIDDYCIGDKLRILPCQHRFHTACIDTWLGLWRSLCPVCKCDARIGNSNPPTSERTPLLSPSCVVPADM